MSTKHIYSCVRASHAPPPFSTLPTLCTSYLCLASLYATNNPTGHKTAVLTPPFPHEKKSKKNREGSSPYRSFLPSSYSNEEYLGPSIPNHNDLISPVLIERALNEQSIENNAPPYYNPPPSNSQEELVALKNMRENEKLMNLAKKRKERKSQDREYQIALEKEREIERSVEY